MFYAFNWLRQPQSQIAAWLRVVNWLRRTELMVFLPLSSATFEPSLVQRRLTKEDLVLLETLVYKASGGTEFGGYTTGYSRTDLTGLCYFRLEETRLEASLAGLIVGKDMVVASTNPLQSAVFQHALVALLNEVPELERIYLPFLEVSDKDCATLRLNELVPDSQAGWWRVLYAEQPAFEGVDQPPTWLELTAQVPSEAVGLVTELFTHYGYRQGVVIERPVMIELGMEDEEGAIDLTAPVTLRTHIRFDNWAEATIGKIREVLFYLNHLHPCEELKVTAKDEEEWNEVWKDFKARRVGQHFIIKSPNESYTPNSADLVINLSTSMWTFGSNHATTTLMLQFLENYLNPAKHLRVLDLGTGSGILAIASARLGITDILALDASSPAVTIAQNNVKFNNLEDKIVVAAGSLTISKEIAAGRGFYTFSEEEQQPPAILAEKLPFDVILANLLASRLITMSETFATSLRPGGLLISSGIIEPKAAEVTAALEKAGFALQERREIKGWVAFVHRKNR
ncbi:MAG: 50S ribosomal protein L11 methyltransferase [Chloroflexota bacterium]